MKASSRPGDPAPWPAPRGGGHTGSAPTRRCSAATGTFSQSKVTTSQRRASSCQQLRVVELADQDGRHLAAPASSRSRSRNRKLQAERVAGERQHAAELAGAEDADAFMRAGWRGSALRQHVRSVCAARNASSADGKRGDRCRPRIAAANSAALVAPAAPMAKVATGMPGGHLHDRQQRIHAVQRLRLHRHAEHRQRRLRRRHARQVRRAAGAGDDRPRARAPRALAAYSNSRSGVRCADTTRTSCGTPSASSSLGGVLSVSQSERGAHDDADQWLHHGSLARVCRVTVRPSSAASSASMSIVAHQLADVLALPAQCSPAGQASRLGYRLHQFLSQWQSRHIARAFSPAARPASATHGPRACARSAGAASVPSTSGTASAASASSDFIPPLTTHPGLRVPRCYYCTHEQSGRLHPDPGTHRHRRVALDEAREAGATQAEASVSLQQGLNVTVRLGEVETIEYQRDRGLGVTVYIDQARALPAPRDLRPEAVRETVPKACSIARYTADECAGLADADRLAREFPDLALYHPGTSSRSTPSNWRATARRRDAPWTSASTTPRAPRSLHRGVRVYGNTHGFLGGFPSTRHSLSCALIAGKATAMQRDYWYTVARCADDLESRRQVGRIAAERTVRGSARASSTRSKCRCCLRRTSRAACSVISSAR